MVTPPATHQRLTSGHAAAAICPAGCVVTSSASRPSPPLLFGPPDGAVPSHLLTYSDVSKHEGQVFSWAPLVKHLYDSAVSQSVSESVRCVLRLPVDFCVHSGRVYFNLILNHFSGKSLSENDHTRTIVSFISEAQLLEVNVKKDLIFVRLFMFVRAVSKKICLQKCSFLAIKEKWKW